MQGNHIFHAPELIYPEFSNILWKKVRRGELTSAEGQRIISAFAQKKLILHTHQSLIQSAYGGAESSGQTIYDWTYLALTSFSFLSEAQLDAGYLGHLSSSTELCREEINFMAESRIAVFRKMLEADPGNTTVRFGLANELLKLESYEEAVAELQTYLSQANDQGNAYGKLAQALERMGRTDEARAAYQQGIVAATQHGHPGMAQDFQLALDDLI